MMAWAWGVGVGVGVMMVWCWCGWVRMMLWVLVWVGEDVRGWMAGHTTCSERERARGGTLRNMADCTRDGPVPCFMEDGGRLGAIAAPATTAPNTAHRSGFQTESINDAWPAGTGPRA